MNRAVKSIVVGVLAAVLVTWSMNWIHPDRAPYYRNSRVLNESAIPAMVPHGPIQPGFSLSQPVNTAKIHVARSNYLDLPVCVVVFLDQSYPTFESAPLEVGLKSGDLERIATIDTKTVPNRFMRICIPDSKLREFQAGSVEVVVRAPQNSQADIAKVILSAKKDDVPRATINGQVTEWSLPYSLEVYRKMNLETYAKNFLVILFPCLMLSIIFVFLPWRMLQDSQRAKP